MDDGWRSPIIHAAAEGEGEGGVSRPHVTTAAADLPLPAAREIRETRERPLPGESVPADRPAWRPWRRDETENNDCGDAKT